MLIAWVVFAQNDFSIFVRNAHGHQMFRIGCPRNKQKKFRFEPKQTETRSVSVVFRFVSWNQKQKISVCFGVSNLSRNNCNKQNWNGNKRKQPKIFRKIPKYALYQTVSVGLLFVSVQSKHRISLFRYRTETTETNCFKQTKTNQNKPKHPKFSEKRPKYPLYHTVLAVLRFVSVQSKHPNSLFLYRIETTETNILFRIVPKLASVTV
jgi:hypothetical protein